MIRDTDLSHRKPTIYLVFALSVQRNAGRLRLGDTRRRLKIYRVETAGLAPKLASQLHSQNFAEPSL